MAKHKDKKRKCARCKKELSTLVEATTITIGDYRKAFFTHFGIGRSSQLTICEECTRELQKWLH